MPNDFILNIYLVHYDDSEQYIVYLIHLSADENDEQVYHTNVWLERHFASKTYTSKVRSVKNVYLAYLDYLRHMP